MQHLLAKENGKNNNYFKIFSDRQVYSLPTGLEDSIAFDPGCILDEEDWFCIKDFSKTKYCIEFVKKQFVSTDYDQLNKNDYNKLDFLLAYEADVYYFQKISSSQIIYKKWFRVDDVPVLEVNKPIIILNETPDAIYQKSKDVLYFRKLSVISRIFSGISEIYREATNQETKTFLKNDFINLNEGFNYSKVKTANRKRIALAMDSLKKFSKEDKKYIFSYVKEYCPELTSPKTDSKFNIDSEEDLKKLLFGIEQRYYTTQLGHEKRLANSVITLKSS